MTDKIVCENKNCCSFNIIPDDQGGYVCRDCGMVQTEIIYIPESQLKVQRTEIHIAGDLGSTIGNQKERFNNNKVHRLAKLQNETISQLGWRSMDASRIFAKLQDAFNLPLKVNQLLDSFRKYYVKMPPRSKARNTLVFASALYLELAKQLHVPIAFRQIAKVSEISTASLFQVESMLSPHFTKASSPASDMNAEWTAEEKLLYTTVIELHQSMDVFAQARSILAARSVSLGARQPVRVGNALVKALKQMGLLNTKELRIYKIAQLLHVSQSALYSRVDSKGKAKVKAVHLDATPIAQIVATQNEIIAKPCVSVCAPVQIASKIASVPSIHADMQVTAMSIESSPAISSYSDYEEKSNATSNSAEIFSETESNEDNFITRIRQFNREKFSEMLHSFQYISNVPSRRQLPTSISFLNGVRQAPFGPPNPMTFRQDSTIFCNVSKFKNKTPYGLMEHG